MDQIPKTFKRIYKDEIDKKNNNYNAVESEIKQDEIFLSKNQLKKLKRKEKWLESKEQIKKYKKEKRKQNNLKKLTSENTNNYDNDKQELSIQVAQTDTDKLIEDDKITDNINLNVDIICEENKGKIKLERHQKRQENAKNFLVKAENGIKLLIDCGYDHLMTEKEIISMAKQITRAYSINKISNNPFNLIVFDIGPKLEQAINKAGCNKWYGITLVYSRDLINFDAFLEKINSPKLTTNNLNENKFKLMSLDLIKANTIYLTGDSTNEISSIDKDKTYIIGGIVDRNRHKLLTLNKATELGISHAKLPIDNYLHLNSSKILATNHVVEILAFYNNNNCDWKQAFCSIIPKRKIEEDISTNK